jgi:PIN domain nuclease of toxin-antitoxin system
MKLLLDTITFLDAAFASRDISKRAKDLLLHPDSELYISVASSWEIAIKYSLGRLALPQRPDQFVPAHRAKMGAEMLPIDEESIFHTALLPDIHKDPFDRILICQAIVHGMILLTPDERIVRYPVRTAW